MSFETGGRADKYGNTYEDRHRASLLVQVALEKLKSINIEQLDAGRDIAEYVVTDNEGKHRYYQCKGSNGTSDSWSIADLNRHKAFTRAREVLSNDLNAEYYFVSPLGYKQLDELCKRARTNRGYEEFKQHQLTHTDKNGTRPDKLMNQLFIKCLNSFGFTSSPENERRTKDLLARCYFERLNCGLEYQADFENKLDAFFMGDPSAIRDSLENFAQDTGWYGRDLTANLIVDHLEKKGFRLRNRIASNTILPQIQELNRNLWGNYLPIQGHLLHRSATDEVLRIVESGGSVVLHGVAGCGKSGCLEELRDELEKRKILYLSLKLDKYPPSGSADIYGQSLGLLQSPVRSLVQLSGTQPCVLILDQLDCLRWSGKNSGTAINICKQLISQAATSNHIDHTKISIVFSSRTVDLENDKGLCQLFESNQGQHEPTAMEWTKVQIQPLSEQEVVQIVGPDFMEMPSRLKKILTVPASLYVWFQLPQQKRSNVIFSAFELMRTWWEDLLKKGDENSFSREELCACKDMLVQKLEHSSAFKLPLSLFSSHRESINFLISQGLLQEGPGNTVSFVHQSFWDYFVAQSLQESVYDGKMLNELLGAPEEQTPIRRYRLFTVLQNLLDSEERIFLKQAYALMDSSNVHYYMKCTVFEVIGQSEQVSDRLYRFIQKYKDIPEWKQYITDTVFYGHPPFIVALEHFQHPDWSERFYLSLLCSVVNNVPDFVIDKIRSCIPRDEQNAYNILHILCYAILPNYASTVVPLCLNILENFPQLWTQFSLVRILIASNAKEALDVLEVRLTSVALDSEEHFSYCDDEELAAFAQKFYRDIPMRLFPCIVKMTASFPQSYNQLNHTLEFWKYTNDTEWYRKNSLREVMNLVKEAFTYWGKSDPASLLTFIQERSTEKHTIFTHELLAHAVFSLPEEYSDDAVEWLLADFTNQVFVFTDDQTDYLATAKALIQKFSDKCSSTLFEKLERTICTWHDSHERMLRSYRIRLDSRERSNQEPCFYPYWGYLQKELLPFLKQNRLSHYAISLLQVLQRNTYIFSPHYHCGILGGQGGTCISPVEGKWLSDSSWLHIVCTPQEKLSKPKFYMKNECCIDASPYAFANALETAARKEPTRFAQLLLQFPQDCLPIYCCHILNALSKSTNGSMLEPSQIFDVVRFLSQREETEIYNHLLRFIEDYLNLSWPQDILDFVIHLALYHSDPDPTVPNEFETNQSPLNTLIDQSLNHVRSHALQVLARIHSENALEPEVMERVIQQAFIDPSPCVLCSFAALIAIYYDTDPSFSASYLKKLAKKNLFAICSNYPFSCWNIFYHDFASDPAYYRQLVKELCKSSIPDIASVGAGWICALSVYHQDQELLAFLLAYSFTEKQQEIIINQAVYSFKNPSHRALSKKIMLHFAFCTDTLIEAAISLIDDNLLSVTEDRDLISCILTPNSNKFAVEDVLDYLYNSDCDLRNYLPVLQTIASNIDYSQVHFWEDRIITLLVRCVTRLFDTDDPQISSACLDIWDELYKNGAGRSLLSEMIDRTV